jgi:hypothetical protein
LDCPTGEINRDDVRILCSTVVEKMRLLGRKAFITTTAATKYLRKIVQKTTRTW